MIITAKIDALRLLKVLAQFPSQTAAEQNKLLNDNVRLLISSSGNVPGLVQIIPPHSEGVSGTAAKKQGEGAVMRDLSRVYANPGTVYAAMKSIGADGPAAAYWAAWKVKDVSKMQRIADSVPSLPSQFKRHRSFDGGSEHGKRRGRNGRVNGIKPSFVVTDPAALKAYRRRKMKNVGMLASAVPSAYSGRFGALRGVPAWVKRHSAPGGYVRDQKTSAGRVVKIGITSRAISDMQRRFNYVLKYRVAAIQRQLPFLARSLEKKLAAGLT
jgi:hypothetical protein